MHDQIVHCNEHVAGMSRGSVDEHGLHQHRGRLLQLAEAAGNKRRSYSNQHTLFKSLQQMTPSPCIATKLLSLEEVVRNDPSYTPNIEHLVFPSRKATASTKASSGKTGARAKLAEVFSLSRHQSARSKQSSQQSTEREKQSSRGSQRKNNKVLSSCN